MTPEQLSRLERLEQLMRDHYHSGHDSSRIPMRHILPDFHRAIDKNAGFFTVTSSAPSGVPLDPFDQIRIYSSGATYRLYWYDWSNAAWRYAVGV